MVQLRLDTWLEGGQPRWCMGVGGGVWVKEDHCQDMGVGKHVMSMRYSTFFFGCYSLQVIHIPCMVNEHHRRFLHLVPVQLDFETKKMGFLWGILGPVAVRMYSRQIGMEVNRKGWVGQTRWAVVFADVRASPGHQEIVLGLWWPQDFRVWLRNFPGLVINSTEEEKSRLVLWATMLFIKAKDFWAVLGMGAGDSWRF